ncbi:ABC transporter permease [Rhodovibrio salinarum]|uniref:ABC transporter permease n=1 Tax=Rhodovibrio salinarum TaxID=1087 RepID=A0A934V356_9PROT|nr:ABC transporter permease [Rhodovibrio salinarum]MBK1699119.1 ABC transporter permease [Rhodovibrio salinarum]
MDQLRQKLGEVPWVWSFLGAAVMWVIAVYVADGKGAGDMLSAAMSFSVYFVIVGIGQMFVITLGPGNIDLSIPANMALSGALAMKVMGGSDAMILVGLLAALGSGVAVGTFNYGLIRILRIPPIIATLSASFLIQSVAISYGRGLRIKPPEGLGEFMSVQLGGVPAIAVLTVGLAAIMAVVLGRTPYGRGLIAIGQNTRAAWLAGINVEVTRYLAYTLCAVFAGLTGALLAAFSGGASLNMGEEYLLSSIAVVVIGGTSIAGGRSNVPGIVGAALFLYLMVTMLNAMGAGPGMRSLMTGLIIVGVITLAGGETDT